MKPRQVIIGLIVAFVLALAVYNGSSKKNSDQSDLLVVPSSATIPPGHNGVIDVRLTNSGPDPMSNTVTFTLTADPHLVIRGVGQVSAVEPDLPFSPGTACTVQNSGEAMTCTANVSLHVDRHLLWRVPVSVAKDAPATAPLELTVTANGNSHYSDPHQANNTTIGFMVNPQAARATPAPSGSTPKPSSTSRPPSSPHSSPTAQPTGSSAAPAGAAPTTEPAKKIENTAQKALAPITIAICLVAVLVALMVGVLVLVARRQQRVPLDYIAPRRDKLH